MTKIYRHRPSVVEAFQFTYGLLSEHWPLWFQQALLSDRDSSNWVFRHMNSRFVLWNQGNMIEISENDFVILNHDNTISLLSEEDFANNYEGLNDGNWG